MARRVDGALRDRRPRGEIVSPNLLEQELEFETTPRGLRAVRTVLVENVSGTGERVLANAINAPGIPRRGRSFDGIPELLVTGHLARLAPKCTDKVYVTIRYGFPDITGIGIFDNPPDAEARPVLETDSTVVMKRTNKDIHDDVIELRNYRAVEYLEDGTPLGLKPEPEPIQGGMVDVPVTVAVLRYHRREPPIDNRGRLIGAKSKAFTGKANETSLSGEDPRGSWLCSRLGAATDDGGASYNVTYEFQYNVDGWLDATIVYIDPKTGRPGDGVGFSPLPNGIAAFQVTHTEEFHDLDLYL